MGVCRVKKALDQKAARGDTLWGALTAEGETLADEALVTQTTAAWGARSNKAKAWL
jgi:hypothetical protein